MKDKVALITGASSGMGAGTAVLFASKGCLLSLTGRNIQGLQDTLSKCLAAGAKKDQVLLIPADLGKEEDIPKILDLTLTKFGRLDILVNNAALSGMKPFEQTTLDEYDTLMQVNTRAVFQLTQLAIPHLIKTKGNVVNVSSVGSIRPLAIGVAYGMSKAALDYFSKCLALEMGRHQVRVNTINPGYVPTNILRDSAYQVTDSVIEKYHALGRGGTVQEMAKAIAFLADDEQSSFITGINMIVDGGSSLLGPAFD